MKARLILLPLLTMLPQTLMAAEPFARSTLLTKGKIVAGQQVEIAIDVFAPNFFKAAPDFPMFEIKDAIVTLPDQRAFNLNEDVGDTQYSGIRKSYMVMAEHAGSFALPPTDFAITYADDDGNTLTRKASLPALSFTADDVPGDWAGQAPLVSGKVTISQTLDRNPAELTVGDAVVRNLTVSADDTQPMMIPVPVLDAPAGMKAYRADPGFKNAGSESDTPEAVSRIENVTYVAEKAGTITLPAVDIKWFDPETGTIQTAEAPALKLEIKDNPAPVQAIPAGPSPQNVDREATRRAVNRYLFHIALLAIATLAVFSILYYLGAWLRARWDAAQRRRAQSEAAYFGHLQKALAGREPMRAWRSLDAWTTRLGYRTTSQWAATTDHGEAREALGHFENALFGGGGGEQSAMAELARCLPAARQQTLSAKTHIASTNLALPPLNP